MENYVANVIPHLQQWWPVIIRLAYLIGIVFAVVSLVQAVSRKQRFNRSTAIWSFICAVLLLRACLETHLSIMKRFNSMLAMAI